MSSPRTWLTIFAAGKQARVPLLAGWNADEIRAGMVLAKQKPTVASFAEQTRKRFGDRADGILKAYAATTDAEAVESAAALASDLFIGYATWKWIEAHARTGRAPVYRFSFDREDPRRAGRKRSTAYPPPSRDIGARHAGEIEYVFGTLDSVRQVTWESSDRTLSDAMTSVLGATSHGRATRMVPACRNGRATTRAAAGSCISTRRSATQPMRCGPATRRSTRTLTSSARGRAPRPAQGTTTRSSSDAGPVPSRLSARKRTKYTPGGASAANVFWFPVRVTRRSLAPLALPTSSW